MRILTCCAATICLSGCYSFPTQTLKAVNSAYTGQHVDEFFLAHGLPSASYELASGDVIYEWASKAKSIHFPARTRTTGYTNYAGGFQTYSTTSSGKTIRLYCVLQIVTSPEGIVRNIDLTTDTIGAWETSRFAEIFSEYKRALPPGDD